MAKYGHILIKFHVTSHKFNIKLNCAQANTTEALRRLEGTNRQKITHFENVSPTH